MRATNYSSDAIDRALSRDRGRLLYLRRQLRERHKDSKDQNQLSADAKLKASFEQALFASINARQARESQKPQPAFDDTLPIAAHGQRIIDAIIAHQVIVIAGETGSGKTTQLPKLCLAAGRGSAGMIGCTQPRRIAARSVARRVAEELQVSVGTAVGYQVRFNENVGDNTYIKFMTDGILLAEIQRDRWLSAYDTIIIDEAHERSLNIDFLLGYLKDLLQRRRDLKLIVTSATIDTSRFSQHFNDAPIIEVEGRSYPVETRYRPLEGDAENEGERTIYDAIVSACDEATREDPRGDVLIFLPGEREIRETHQILDKRKYRETDVLPLYARLSNADQDRVFHPGPRRRIVLSTNVAETSLTVPRIRFVIDPGMARIKRYSPRGKLDRLQIEPISQASADQRKGRCGRVSAGICFRLYAQAEFESRPRFTDPEILRSSLAGVILRMLALGLGKVDEFAFIDPPDSRAIADGWQQLAELGAVDDRRQLTAIGRRMAEFPVDVKLARMLIAAKEANCLREVLIIAAFLGIQDPRERPADAREAADRAQAKFIDERSEFVGILRLWDAYRLAHEDLTQSKLRDWCNQHFLGFLRMREWRELHRQLLLQCESLNWPLNETAAEYPQLHRALLVGLPGMVGYRGEKGIYDAPRSRKFQIFPGSSLGKAAAPWVMFASLLDTQKVWSLTNAKIEPQWAIDALPHLLSRRYFDPHWSRKQGRVTGFEQITLFGLVLAPRRPIDYGRLFAEEAREIFVRDALIPGEIDTRIPLIKRNLAVIDKAREEEAKARRAGLIVDEQWQLRWYLDRLPADINSTSALEKWYGKLDAQQKHALEWSLEDLLLGEGEGIDRYPKYMTVGQAKLALHYRFEPAAEDDGVTLDVPIHLLLALDLARLSWLVPGLLEEKATALIRGLPKALRRNFIPAPDFSRAFYEAYSQGDADSLPGTLARFLRKTTGIEITALDFDESAIDAYLRINIRLADRDGKILALSRDLSALKSRYGKDAEQAFALQAGQNMARSGLTQFPDEPIAEQVIGVGGIPAFPALVDVGDSVDLQVFADAQQASRAHIGGIILLARLALADKLKSARKQLPISAKVGMVYATLESAERLREDLVNAAFAVVLGENLDLIRDRNIFEQRVTQAKSRVFEQAMQRLALVEKILTIYAQIKPNLESPLMGWAAANLDDLKRCLQHLVHPGFLRTTIDHALQQMPRYLAALNIRAQRALVDPVRDQQRMLEIAIFDQALEKAKLQGKSELPAWQQMRWELEELRVSVYAQELGTPQPVSIKRLAKKLADLQRQT